MLSLQEVITAVEHLTPEERRLLRHYLDNPAVPMAGEKVESKPRILGLNKGALTISDDFTDPLPDEFWLG